LIGTKGQYGQKCTTESVKGLAFAVQVPFALRFSSLRAFDFHILQVNKIMMF